MGLLMQKDAKLQSQERPRRACSKRTVAAGVCICSTGSHPVKRESARYLGKAFFSARLTKNKEKKNFGQF